MLPATEDLKRKMYGCILVVGGGMKFTGIGTWLQNRISLQIPYMYRAGECGTVPFLFLLTFCVSCHGAKLRACLYSI